MNFKNTRFLQALNGEKVDCTPIWLMRQAGRYLPEYRATREKAGNFLTLCKTPELACEVTIQPLQRFDLDAAILFSDILTIPDAMNLGLTFGVGEGPKFARPVRTENDVMNLQQISSLDYVFDAVRLIKSTINVPLIGFAGSPWTLATYMVEGGSSKDFNKIKELSYSTPHIAHTLLAKLRDSVIDYLQHQIKAGVDVVMIFDTWGGVLPFWAYREFSLNYMVEIIKNLTVPTILFTKGGGQYLSEMATSGAAALGIDWTTSLAYARKIVGEHITLQGNLDPALMCSNPKTVRNAVRNVLADYGYGNRHIFNLGHGITPDAKIENVEALIAAVREFSPKYH